MTTHLKAVRATFIIAFILVGTLFTTTLISPTSTTASAKLISFNSYMDLTYNSSILNKPLQIDVAVAIPVTVKYWTDIPDIFGKIPWPFNFLILYGRSIAPMQKIHVELLNTPDWANIYFSSQELITEVPLKSEGIREITTDLIISPKVEAPAESQRLSIKITTEVLGRVSGYSFQKDIAFTPSFIPTIAIEPENPIRSIGPHQSVNFKIIVKNLGNKITRVTPSLIGVDEKWTPTINPPNYEINPGEQSTFSFSLITPYDFGWHNEYGRFQIEFKSEVYPFISGSASSNDSIYLVVNNNGFSAPGFELALVVIAFIVSIAIIQKRRHRNE
jgi:hypothetical protein